VSNDQYHRVTEAAALTYNNPKTIYKWLQAGRVRSKHDGRTILVRLDDVRAARQRDRISQRVPDLPPAGLVTINQAADLSGISRSTILYRARHGLIPSQRYGALWYVNPHRLDIDPVKKDGRRGE